MCALRDSVFVKSLFVATPRQADTTKQGLKNRLEARNDTVKRKIVKINPEKCDGCGLCVSACSEGALQLVDGKAKLVSESYCDGLGDCLPECPTGAITIEEREAAPFDGTAVQEYLQKKEREAGCAAADSRCPVPTLDCGCRGPEVQTIHPVTQLPERGAAKRSAAASQLRQWPCQLWLVPVHAPYLEGAHLLIAADCTAYAYAGFHESFMREKVTFIACPKLDHFDYAAKLADMLKQHELKSITVLKMEVPCCNGLLEMVKSALHSSGKPIPWSVVTVSTDGNIVEER